ncbi:MAG: acyl-CoA dehydrogenase family protein, partial [Hyphomicrobium sp.]
MAPLVLLLVALVAFLALGMVRAPLWGWAAAVGVLTLLATGGSFDVLSAIAWLPFLALAVLSIPAVRRSLIVAPVFAQIRKILPKVSGTEAQALEAGTVGFDAELFSGKPDWDKLKSIPPIQLSTEEQAFLDGPTEELCRMINDWQVRHSLHEVPDEIWDFVKKNGFLGMLISKEHGGLGFSPQAQSLILGKIASRSPDVVTIVMVPNSLGPGELIEKYGTDEQKRYYLPRLAKGEEVPCFSLTGPTSGSDAATMRDIGYVTHGTYQGKDTLGVRLSWEKRYITLGPKATLVGLAFRLFDKDNLLGKGEDVG